MRNELNRMVTAVTDPAKKKVSSNGQETPGICRFQRLTSHKIFDAEMQSFFLLFNRFLLDRAKGEKL